MKGAFRYVHEYRNRHGKIVRYFRAPQSPKIRLLAEPGTDEFVAEYAAALAGYRIKKPTSDKRELAQGTISAALAGYYSSNHYLALAAGTRAMRRSVLERFRGQERNGKRFGEGGIATIQQVHIAKLLSEMKPYAAHNWLTAIRHFMKFAVSVGLRKDDPTASIEKVKATAGTIHSWTEAEIEQYQAFHPVGTRERLAMALLLFTGQRRSDVVRMGWQHITGNRITVRQQKTGTVLQVPIHRDLAALLREQPRTQMTFLVTSRGAPFSSVSFGNAFREWCDKAGLPQCSAHGLRKAQCRRLAEAGCSAPQIAAISGHKSLSEVQRYIEAANQQHLADMAMGMIGGTEEQNKIESVAHPFTKEGSPAPKPLKNQ